MHSSVGLLKEKEVQLQNFACMHILAHSLGRLTLENTRFFLYPTGITLPNCKNKIKQALLP